MIRRTETPSDPIATLLRLGLDHYGRNEVEEAVRCWRGVLAIDPQHETARDYLESAGVEADVSRAAEIIDFGAARAQLATGTTPVPPAPQPAEAREQEGPGLGPLARPRLERFLRERRYEEALTLLYAARAHEPNDPEIVKSIRLIRERLTGDYTRELGSLDRVPELVGRADGSGNEDQRHVLSLVDGVSSCFDIVAASSLGKLATLRILCALFRSGQLVAALPEISRDSRGSGRRPVEGRAAPSETRPAVSESRPARVEGRPARSDGSAVYPTGVRAAGPAVRRAGEAGGDTYAELFARATRAYLVRDMALALELFGECRRLRPEDPRPSHNLKALHRRVGK